MQRLIRCLALLATAGAFGSASAAVPVPLGARDEGAFDDGEARIEARLLVHPETGDERRRRLGVLFELDPGWHLYWRNPGDSGLAPDLAWEIEGAPRLAALEWPAPAPFAELEGELQTFGYAERVLLATEATWDGAFTGPRSVRVVAEVLVCEHECIPGRVELATTLPALPAPDAPLVRQLFEDAAASLPLTPEEAGVALAVRLHEGLEEGAESVRLSISVDPCPEGPSEGEGCDPLTFADGEPALYPDERSGVAIDRLEPSLASDAGHLVVEVAGTTAGDPGAVRLSGVLALRGPEGPRPVSFDLPLAPSTVEAGVSLALALALGLVGGLVLNLMPCVLPVLAMKVFAVVESAAHDAGGMRRHAAAYAFGIELSMLSLAAAVLALRAGGTSLGWGFQLQEPLFVAGIAVVLVIFAMNLFGLFEIGAGAGRLASVGAQATGARRSFFEGLLAVLLATPCTAPFLGTAVGFAFAAPPAGIISIFLAIGAGLAAPFVLVSWVPSWSRWIPRSGAWMLRFRAGLGFALLATVVWLVWVFGRTSGPDGTTALLALLLAVAFASWLFGLAQHGGRRGFAALLGTAMAVIALGGVGLLRVEGRGAAAAPEAEGAWQPYTSAAVESALADGQRVFVAFGADWCITCKVNERLVLADDRVEEELDRLGYARFKADWTLRDETIRAELARFGKAGVPLYLVYEPAAPRDPVLLPELLTTDRVIDALRGEAS